METPVIINFVIILLLEKTVFMDKKQNWYSNNILGQFQYQQKMLVLHGPNTNTGTSNAWCSPTGVHELQYEVLSPWTYNGLNMYDTIMS